MHVQYCRPALYPASRPISRIRAFVKNGREMKSSNAWRQVLMGALFLMGGAASNAENLGSSFNANVKLDGWQVIHRSAVAGNGDKAILFEDGDAQSRPVLLRRFDALGKPLTTTDVYLGYGVGDIAMDRTGGYAIAYEETYFGVKDIYFAVFNRDGSTRVPATKASIFNTSNGASEINSSLIAMAPDGRVTVGWRVTKPDWSVHVVARTFSWDGAPTSPETFVRSGDGYLNPIASAIKVNAKGAVNIAWREQFKDSAGVWLARVMYRKFDLQLKPLTAEIYVNAGKRDAWALPEMAMNTDGNLLVAWHALRFNADGSKAYREIDVQRFSPAGTLVSTPIKLNTREPSDYDMGIGMTEGGSFTASWTEYDSATNTQKVMHRDFSSAGVPLDVDKISMTSTWSSTTSIGGVRLSTDPFGRSLLFSTIKRPTTLSDVLARQLQAFNALPVTDLKMGTAIGPFAGAVGKWTYFRVMVPNGSAALKVTTTGTTGNADLFGYIGSAPTGSRYDVAARTATSAETITVIKPTAGAWYFGVYGTTAFTDAKISVSY